MADEIGTSTFHYVKNAPAFSGLKRRDYEVKHPDIQEIEVSVRRLDDIIEPGTHVDFIKIDVEGAELGVLKGAKNTLKKHKPIVVFECGLGASEYYGTKPEDVARFFQDIGMKLYTLLQYVQNKAPLTTDEFVDIFNKNSEYYFVAR